MNITEIPLNEIFSDDEFNCRGEAISPFDVMELAKNIQRNGLVQPIVVQPYDNCPKPEQKYRIVVGHRRYQAHIVNSAPTIKAIVREGMTDEEAFTINLVENLERKDLNVFQEAKSIERYIMWGHSQKGIAHMIKKSAGWVQTRVTLLSLPVKIQEEAAAGFLTTEQIKHLGSLKSSEEQFEIVRQIKDAKLKGQKFSTKKKHKKKIDPNTKSVRSEQGMLTMLDMVYDQIGANAFTRTLAWASGNISTLELMKDIQVFAEMEGKTFRIPRDLIDENLIPESMK